jgi:lipoic acid synthetase
MTPPSETPSPRAGLGRRPEWLKARLPSGERYAGVRAIMERHALHTVCQEARCPNMGECWNSGTATFMILGDVCTRSCGFCAVKTGRPTELDAGEPRRVAEAVQKLSLHHVVITSVDRDELYDGGSQIFAETIREVRRLNPEAKIEVLIPDFKGEEFALQIVLDAMPDVLNHNLETVPRLYGSVRPQAKYERSLELLSRAKRRGFLTKTGLMLGIGERTEEVIQVLHDLVGARVDALTLGQYLQPTKDHLPVDRFITPEEFRMLKSEALALGMRYVESGPLVRSSYHAERVWWKPQG